MVDRRVAIVAVHADRSVIHNHVGTGERGQSAFDANCLIGATALRLEFQVVVLARVECIKPNFGEGAEFKCGLAIKFTFAKQNRDVRKICFGFLDGMEFGDCDRCIDETGRGGCGALGMFVRQ